MVPGPYAIRMQPALAGKVGTVMAETSGLMRGKRGLIMGCLLYTSDAADE